MVEIRKIKSGEENEMEIFINWSYLASGRGFRKVENVLQVITGRLAFWLIFVIELGIIVSEFTKGYNVRRLLKADSLSALIFWVLALVFLYSMYLLRNRENFLDRARTGNLKKLRKQVNEGRIGRFDITNYLNHASLWAIDYVLNLTEENYLGELFVKLSKLPKASSILGRLGLNRDDFDIDILRDYSVRHTKTAVIEDLLTDSFKFAYDYKKKYIDEEAIMFILLNKYYKDYLQKYDIVQKDLNGIGLWIKNEAIKQRYVEEWKDRISIKPSSTVNRAYTSRFTPTLNEFSRDFTNAVIKGDFKISIARERELGQMTNLLEKGEKSAVMVVGEPGVGKTTLIKSLAVRMVVEDVPEKLRDMRLVAFDFNKAFSSSKKIETFKSKLRKVFEEVSQSGNVVLVLDNFNQLLNLRSEIAGELANIIVDSFDAYNFRMIATTDSGQLTRFIRPHRALAGMFSQVKMEIPSDEVATQITIDEVPGIEKEYNVKIAYSAVKASIELSHKFAYDRVLPDKAIDILKETVVNFKHLAGQKAIEFDEVAKVVSSKVGVSLGSITEDESKRLSKLEEEMHKRVIDQDTSIEAVCGALRRARSGIVSGNKPVASFLFFGPTGVGKTEVAKTVADVYYGSEERMVRVDMSEYHEEENLKRLIGFTSAQGAFEGGFLTEPIHNNPFSLVLLDEIDKANPKVLDLFLQVLDEGYLDDGLGRRVDFSNTIIIATSNAGSRVIADMLEKGETYKGVEMKAKEELKKVFRIEFLNRFDKIIMFKSLTREEIKLVAKKFVEQIRLKLLDKGIKLNYGDDLLERLANMGYSPVFGAREMRRTVQEEVENRVADMIVKGEVRTGGEVRL